MKKVKLSDGKMHELKAGDKLRLVSDSIKQFGSKPFMMQEFTFLSYGTLASIIEVEASNGRKYRVDASHFIRA